MEGTVETGTTERESTERESSGTGSTQTTSDILQIYQTVVQMADNVSARRAGANTFFLTLDTALAAAVGVVSAARKPGSHGATPSFDAFGLVCTAIAGAVASLTWLALIRYYRRLNEAKFSVINSMEKALPAQPFTDEWAMLSPRRRWEATVVEQVVPLVFVGIYLTLGLRVIFQ